jgi:hypothetical protein
VFALLGLTNTWGRRRPIAPDYKATVHQLFREVVREMIGVTNDLSIFSGTLNQGQDLPSWIPDWSIAPDPLEVQRLQLEKLYDASKNSRPSHRMLGENLIELKGWLVDMISETSVVMPATEGIGIAMSFQKWHKMANLNEEPNKAYLGGGTWSDAYWRTLCGDAMFSGSISE